MNERDMLQQQAYSQAQCAAQGAYRATSSPPPERAIRVTKHARFTVRKTMTPRERKDFAEELEAKVAKGYRVFDVRKTGLGLEVLLMLEESLGLGEFVDELQAQLSEEG